MIDAMLAWSIRRPFAVLIAVAALLVGGIVALRSLRIEALPDLTDAQVQVLVDAPGLSPLEVERLVAFPIEVAMNGLPDVSQVRSTSKYGFAVVTIVFEEGTDIYFARTLVNERLQGVTGSLPEQADASLGPLAGAISEIYLYALDGPGHDAMELRTIHDRIVRPQLRSVPGIVEVNAFGGFVRQVQITIQPERLAAHGLTLHDVVEAVGANNAIAAGGYLESGDEQYILRGLGQATTAEDLRQTVIVSRAGVPVLIRDVADVGDGAELRQGAVSRDGKGEVVTGIVMMRRGENSREVVRRVRERVALINQSLPDSVQVVPYYDQTDLVAGTLKTVRTNLIEGGLLVIAILLVFLGNVRAALIVAATIPLSLLCAFIGMRWLGLSANLMSLGAIDFGMIVDGSVVMAEQFVRSSHEHGKEAPGPNGLRAFKDRLLASAREVGRPIGFGVLIILLVYVPILSLQGLEGRMFRPMAITVALALFGSLLLALAFVPAMATFAFRRGATEARYAIALADRLDRLYAPALRGVLGRPTPVIAGAVVLFFAAMSLVPRLGSEFIPELDEGSITIQAARDPSVSLTHSVAMQREMERVLLEVPEVTTVVSRVGRPEIGSDPMGVNMADVFVMLRPHEEWRSGVSKDELIEEMDQLLDTHVPGLAFSFTQPMAMRLDELISGVRADVAIKVFGDDPEQLAEAGAQIAELVSAVPGAVEVQMQSTQGQTYLNVRLHRDALARYGIPIAEVQEALELAVGRRPVSQVVEGTYAVDVVVQYPEELRSSVDAIGAIAIPAGNGARVALAQLAEIALQSGPVQVGREGAQRLVVVQANVRGRDLGGFAAEVQQTVADGAELPAGTFVSYGGEFENQQRALSRLKLVVPVSISVIALLLTLALRSWSLAALVLINLPFAAVGGVVALWLRGMHLSVSSAIGFIALFGVAVLNGLVLLNTVQRQRMAGMSPDEAALSGARLRLRPVLMTALVASIGFLPVAISTGTGAEVQRPLATVVIGGLATSTLLTLFLVPALYAIIERSKTRRSPDVTEAPSP
jgi:cobalt-zinc-cadmium resistance protein CzcA